MLIHAYNTEASGLFCQRCDVEFMEVTGFVPCSYAILFGCEDNSADSILEDEDKKAEEESDDDEEEDLDDEIRLGPSGQEHTAILDNLLPCTECRFGVSTVSNTGEQSPEVIEILSTNGTGGHLR